MTDYLNPGVDSEILHGGWLLVLNYVRATGRVTFRASCVYCGP